MNEKENELEEEVKKNWQKKNYNSFNLIKYINTIQIYNSLKQKIMNIRTNSYYSD